MIRGLAEEKPAMRGADFRTWITPKLTSGFHAARTQAVPNCSQSKKTHRHARRPAHWPATARSRNGQQHQAFVAMMLLAGRAPAKRLTKLLYLRRSDGVGFVVVQNHAQQRA